jgi:hypothetical protein
MAIFPQQLGELFGAEPGIRAAMSSIGNILLGSTI